MENKTLKEEFIEDCNIIVNEKNNCILFNVENFLSDIFDIYVTGNVKDFNNIILEAVTQEYIFEIIEEGIIFILNLYDQSCFDDYIYIAILRSGLQFLVDYAESNRTNEDTRSVRDIKKRLQTILTHKSIIKMTERLYELKKLCTIDYLNKEKIDLTHIPLSHDWWKRK